MENSRLKYNAHFSKSESKQNEINNFFILNQNSTNIQKNFPNINNTNNKTGNGITNTINTINTNKISSGI